MQQSSRVRRMPVESKPHDDTTTPLTSSVESRHPDPDLIAQAAYRRYEARGREDGHDVEDWLAAEREFSAASTSANATGRDESDAA